MSITHKVSDASVRRPAGLSGDRLSGPLSSSIIVGVWIAAEFLAILLIGATTFYSIIEWRTHAVGYYASAVCFYAVTTFLLNHFAGNYSFSAIVRPFDAIDRILVVFGTAFLLLLAVAFSLKVSEIFSRVWMYTFALSACGGVVALRFGGSAAVRYFARRGVFVRNVAVLGGGDQGKRFLSHVAQKNMDFVNVIGVFDDRRDRVDPVVEGHQVLGNLRDLVAFARANRVDDVVIALPWSADRRLQSIIDLLRELPVNIHLSSDLAGFSLNCREAPAHFEHARMFEVSNTPLSGWGTVLKMLEDRVLSFFLILLFSPIMTLVALAIKLEDPGPVLFRQKRYGFNNRPFHIYKFRSMYCNRPEEDKTVQAVREDPRITKVGRFIRRTSLDELPQLFNVLKGSMSLVGPRPHAVDHNEEYSQKIGGYFARHKVKPGMTGWAQVNGWRGETDTLEKMAARVEHDLYYAENWSVWFDLKILALTAYVVLRDRNAY